MFVGRKPELQFLNNHYVKSGNQVLIVYGAKGVGKTSLIKEFAISKKGFYYAVRACSDREQRYQWACEFSESGLEISPYPEYRELFEKLLPETKEKQILILDEFQYLVRNGGGFLDELIQFLKNRRTGCPVMVIMLCSDVGWLENSMLSCIGRGAACLSGFLKLRELTFSQMQSLFPGYSIDDCIRNYAVLGGNPGLWHSFSEKLSFEENMIRNLLTKESRLYREISSYLEEELRETAVYNTILAAIARDCNKLNDIYVHTGYPRARINVYLKNLIELDIVDKVCAGVYRIANPCVRFYFRFLFPHNSLLEEVSPKAFYEKVVAESLPAYVEESYCKICRQDCQRELPEKQSAVEWVGKDVSLDIVAVDGENKKMVATCAYGHRMEVSDYERLLFCAEKAKIHTDRVVLYCESGFSEELELEALQGRVELRSIRNSTVI